MHTAVSQQLHNDGIPRERGDVQEIHPPQLVPTFGDDQVASTFGRLRKAAQRREVWASVQRCFKDASVSVHRMEHVGDDGSRLIISSILLRKISSPSFICKDMFNRLDLLCCSSQDLVRLEALPISRATRSCTLSADVPGRLGILMLLRNGEHYNINHKRVCRSNSMYDQLKGLFELCSSLPSWWEMTKRGVAETRGVNSLESKWRRIIHMTQIH